MSRRVVAIAFSLALVFALFAVGAIIRPRAAASSTLPRLYLTVVEKNVQYGIPSGAQIISGTLNVSDFTVPSGSTTVTEGDTTIHAQGNAIIAGTLLIDGGNLTVTAGGDVTITGRIAPVLPASGESPLPGSLAITGQHIAVLAADPSLVAIASPGDITITATASTTAAALQPQINPPAVSIGASMSAGRGALGDTVTQTVGAVTGLAGGKGGDVTIPSSVAIGNAVTIQAGNGGPGGQPELYGADGCPGASLAATGGAGGAGGSITLGGTDASGQPYPVVLGSRAYLKAGFGGDGGGGHVDPGSGSDPGCNGGSGTGTGGAGGKGGSVILSVGTTIPGDAAVFEGSGGPGGDAGVDMGGGGGKAGAYPASPQGGSGGDFNLRGGNGGDAGSGPGTPGQGGAGGEAYMMGGGNGGDGANGCAVSPPRTGGAGGAGGSAGLYQGADGQPAPSTVRTPSFFHYAGNGGAGGRGTTGGSGGAGGILVKQGTFEADTSSFNDGSAGLSGCPTLTFGGAGDGGAVKTTDNTHSTNGLPGCPLPFAGTNFAPSATVAITGTSNYRDKYGPFQTTTDASGNLSLSTVFWVSETQVDTWTAATITDTATIHVTATLSNSCSP